MKEYKVLFKRSPRERIGFTYWTASLTHIFYELGELAQKIKKNIVITSVNDHKHRVGSLHYQNKAVDVRVWNLDSDDRLKIVNHFNNLKGGWALDEEDHIHIEWRTK